MRTSRILFVLIALILAAVIWRLVDYGISHERPPSAVPVLGASNFPMYDIVRTIGGDAVQVLQIVPTGADPHTFEPSPSIVALLSGADAVYGLDNDYDHWIAKYLSSETDFVSLSAGITQRTLPDGDIDPHMWLTIPNAKQMAAEAARDLSNRFPANRITFEENYAGYIETLDQADEEIRNVLRAAPRTSLVTGHDAWYYFADAYDFTILGTVEEDHGSEPSARHLEELRTAMSNAGVRTIFADAGVQSDALQQFARDNDFTVLTVDPEGAHAHDSYIQLMKANAEAFSNNQ